MTLAGEKRDGKIELMRFYGILTIMCGHLSSIGLGELERPFKSNWIFVEFFFILSGFFAAKHFDSRGTGKVDPASAVTYTLHKFKRFLPYVIAAVALEYFVKYWSYVQNGEWFSFLKNVEDMPLEMLLLSAANTNGTRLFALWFLSASFLVFPLVCLVAQLKNKYVKLLIAFYPALLYYLYRLQSIGNHTYPNQLIRAFCGLMLGILTYCITEYLKGKDFSKRRKAGLSVLLAGIYILLLIIGYKNWLLTSTYLICFVLTVSLTFSDSTYLPSCSNRLFLYLGELSMPMYIWHQPLGHFFSSVYRGESIAVKIAFFYLGTIILSAFSLWAVKKFMKRKRTAPPKALPEE